MAVRLHKIKIKLGFTLIELLVVISIIALLIGLALPALSKARNTAKNTAATAQMRGIVVACENYHNDFGAYPGLIKDDLYVNTSTITASQAMFVSLTRRFYSADPAGPGYAGSGTVHITVPAVAPYAAADFYVENDPSIKPKNYASLVTSGGRQMDTYEPYLTPKPTDYLDPIKWKSALTAGIPCFVDSGGFKSDAMPILYYRMSYKWDPDNATLPSIASLRTAQSSAVGRACYYSALNSGIENNAFDAGVAASATTLEKVVTTSTGTPPILTPKNGFVLISAGVDRTFGTSDDIAVGGGD